MRSRAEAAPSLLWVPDLPGAPGVVELSPEESHYVGRVCRARPGDVVLATDGRGGLARLRITSLGLPARGEVEHFERSERRRRAWVCSGPPEGRRADWLVEKLAELGIDAWQPVDCERSSWSGGTPALERWRRLAVAALRQSRRRFLMEVRAPAPLAEVLPLLPAPSLRMLAGGRGVISPTEPGITVGLVGPSGGLTERERGLLAGAGFGTICLSDGRLRAETAGVVWAAWWAVGESQALESPALGGAGRGGETPK